jgi:mercuric ion binding protein
MKTNIIFIFLLVFAAGASNNLFAQSKTAKATIKVYGNCGMCKSRIETALDRQGVKLASWDTKTKNLEVVYNSKKITEDKIHELIAGVGMILTK